jgi:hypothetical protein
MTSTVLRLSEKELLIKKAILKVVITMVATPMTSLRNISELLTLTLLVRILIV